MHSIPLTDVSYWKKCLHHFQMVFVGKSTSSCKGICQGDPLDPALFSTAIHPILAYLDDVFLLGPPSAALESLRTSFVTVHLEIADSKNVRSTALVQCRAKSAP